MRRFLLTTFCLITLWTGLAAAQGCCSPGSPATGGLEKGGLEAKQLRILPTVSYTHLGKLISGSNEINNLSNHEINAWAYALDVEYGVTPRITVLTSLNYNYRSRRLEAQTAGGGTIDFDADADGLGDAVLLGKFKLSNWNLQSQREIDVGIGVGFPTGAYDLKSGGVKVSRDLLPGSGAYRMILWSFLYKSFRPAPVGISLSLTYNRPGTSEDDYRYAATLDYVAGVTYELTDLFDLYLQASGQWSGSDKYLGRERSGTGGSRAYAQPGIGVKPFPAVSFYAIFQTPVYHDLNGTQLTTDAGVKIGSVITLGAR